MIRLLLIAQARVWKCLPVGSAVLAGRLAGWTMQHVLRFRLDVVRRQLHLAFAETATPDELAELLTRVYRHLGLLLVELLRLPQTSPAHTAATYTLTGKQHLDAALARGKGVLMLSGHIGNWEQTGLLLINEGLTVSAVGKEMKGRVGETYRRLIRDENGVGSIPRRHSLKRIFKALRNNEIVAFMLDQNVTADEGVFVDFFGVPACTLGGLVTLAQRTGAAVVPAFSRRDPDLRRHCCTVQPELTLQEPPDGDPRDFVTYNTQRFTSCLEAAIRECPDQWLWLHKRWRTHPADAGKPRITY